MSQRGSGYARKALDNYETPDWVTHAVVPHALVAAGCTVEASDISDGRDFLKNAGNFQLRRDRDQPILLFGPGVHRACD